MVLHRSLISAVSLMDSNWPKLRLNLHIIIMVHEEERLEGGNGKGKSRDCHIMCVHKGVTRGLRCSCIRGQGQGLATFGVY